MLCPNCRVPDLMTSHASGELQTDVYVCLNCNSSFTRNELMIQWGWDVGDFFDDVSNILKPTSLQDFDYISSEPFWIVEAERIDAYAMVTRMFLGIKEYDEYFDHIRTMEDART